MRLITRAELARIAGVSGMAITKRCAKELAPATDETKRVDVDHPSVRRWLDGRDRGDHDKPPQSLHIIDVSSVSESAPNRSFPPLDQADLADRLHARRVRAAKVRAARDQADGTDSLEPLVAALLCSVHLADHEALRACFEHGIAAADPETLDRLMRLVRSAVAACITNDAVDLERFAAATDRLEGLDSPAGCLRYAFGHVAAVLDRTRRLGANEAHAGAPWLRARLIRVDRRFEHVDVQRVTALLVRAAASTTSTGNQGRGLKGARSVLAEMMAECGAFEVRSVYDASDAVRKALD